MVLSLGASLFVFELALRLLKFSHPVFHMTDQELGVKLRPGVKGWQTREGQAFVEINSNGFRDRQRIPKKGEFVYRVAVLGDSYTEALQVNREDTFCSVIETNLGDRELEGYASVEVLNFGVAGYGTGQELMLLEGYVEQFEPDLVVLAFLTGNDIRNNSMVLETSKRPFYFLEKGELRRDYSFRDSQAFRIKSSLPFVAFLEMSEHVRLLQLANRTRFALQAIGHQRGDSSPQSEFGLDYLVYQDPFDESWREAWEVTEAILVEMAEESARQKAAFLVVTLSNSDQVNPDTSIREGVCQSLGIEDLFYPDRRVAAFCESQGIEFLTLAPLLLEEATKRNECFHGFENTKLCSGHWNEGGHAVAGKFISDRIYDSFIKVSN